MPELVKHDSVFLCDLLLQLVNRQGWARYTATVALTAPSGNSNALRQNPPVNKQLHRQLKTSLLFFKSVS